MQQAVETLKRSFDAAMDTTSPDEFLTAQRALLDYAHSHDVHADDLREKKARRTQCEVRQALLREHLKLSEAEVQTYELLYRNDKGFWAEQHWCEYASAFEDPHNITRFHVHIRLRRDHHTWARFRLKQTYETDVGQKVYFSDIDTTEFFCNRSPFPDAQIKALFCALVSNDEFLVEVINRA